MENRHAIEFEMTDELAGRIARAVLADRGNFRRLCQRVGLPLLLLTVLLFWPTLLVLREHLTPAALIASIMVIAAGYYLMLRILVYRYVCWSVLAPFHAQGQRTVRVVFSDEHIYMESGDLSGEQKWKELDAIQVSAKTWFFGLKPGGVFAIPAPTASSDLETLIRRKATEAGTEFLE